MNVLDLQAWQAHTSREHSIVVDLFTGQLRSSVRCVQCSGQSVRFDAFSCLQLPIPFEQLILLNVVGALDRSRSRIL